MLRAGAAGDGVRPGRQSAQAWGGPGPGYDWPENEHGIHIDPKGFVWVGGNGEKDGQILKFTHDGKFVLQIGKPGPQTGSSDTTRLGRPANIQVDPATNEVYVADGYCNHRVIVFDADTGVYKRHWGAYGKPPTDDKRRPTTRRRRRRSSSPIPVHCVQDRQGRAGLRLRPLERSDPGVPQGRHVREGVLRREGTLAKGSVWDLDLLDRSGETYFSMPTAPTTKCARWCARPAKFVGTFGRNGRNAGEFHWVHNIAIDSKGNIYTTEVDTGKRAQKFRYVGPTAR